MPTSADPFIEVQDVVDRIGRGTVTDPGMISAVDAACDMVRTLSGQTFNEDSSTIDLDGTGTDAVILPELPVNSVSSVKLIDTIGTTTITNYALKDNGVLLRTRGAAAAEEDYVETSWPVGRQNVRVSYNHGYDIDDDLPRDVREVALSIASRLVIQGVASEESLGTERIRYGTNATDFTDGERAIMHKYRQVG